MSDLARERGVTGEMRRTRDWLLVETLDLEVEPTVIAQGQRVVNMVRLDRFLARNPAYRAVAVAIRQVAALGEPVHEMVGSEQLTVQPACTHEGRVHGVWVRLAAPNAPTPERNRVWGFLWNLSRGVVNKSKGLSPDDGPVDAKPWSIAEAYSILKGGVDMTETIAKVITADPGMTHQTTWTQERPSGPDHNVNFAVRIMAVPGPDGVDERILRGISHDLGPVTGAEESTTGPLLLGELVAAAAAEPGEYRAILDPTTLRLIRWYGPAAPTLDWEYDPTRKLHRIHPDDRGNVVASLAALGRESSRVAMQIRLLETTGEYAAFDATASLMVLNNRTNAALVSIKRV